MVGRRGLTAGLVGGVLAVFGLTLASMYSVMGDSGDDCDVWTDSSSGASEFVQTWGWLIVLILAYVLFVVGRSHGASGPKHRLLIVAPLFALVLGWLVVVIEFPAIASGIHWKPNAGLAMFFGP